MSTRKQTQRLDGAMRHKLNVWVEKNHFKCAGLEEAAKLATIDLGLRIEVGHIQYSENVVQKFVPRITGKVKNAGTTREALKETQDDLQYVASAICEMMIELRGNAPDRLKEISGIITVREMLQTALKIN